MQAGVRLPAARRARSPGAQAEEGTMAGEIGLFEAMATMRAMRRLRPDPVPDELIWKVLEAATKAPSGGNRQPWHFVVVRDAATKKFIQERYLAALQQYAEAGMKALAEGKVRLSAEDAEAQMRTARAGFYLAEHLAEVPVLVLVGADRDAALDVGGSVGEVSGVYASVYPAVQNLLLACRGLGLGAVLTTLHLLYEEEIKMRLGIPPRIFLAAMIPVGYPEGRFGPVRRRPVEEVTHWERWGERRARPG